VAPFGFKALTTQQEQQQHWWLPVGGPIAIILRQFVSCKRREKPIGWEKAVQVDVIHIMDTSWPRICHCTWHNVRYTGYVAVQFSLYRFVIARRSHVDCLTENVTIAFFSLVQGRSLSCAALLVAPTSPAAAAFGGNCSNIARNRSLFLVDATGSYPVRALALGGGMTTVVVKKEPVLSKHSTLNDDKDKNSRNSRSVAVADEVNRRLCHVDFSNLTAKQGLEHVSTILSGKLQHHQLNDAIIGANDVANNNNNNNEEKEDYHPALLAHDTRLELAVAYFDKQGFTRLGLSSLFNKQTSNLIQ
jgi:hypothetical protein